MNARVSHHAIFLRAKSLEESHLPKEYQMQTSDVLHYVFDVFGIDEARLLTSQSALKATTAEGRTFVLFCNRMTLQAQNALLKLFEEPPSEVRFYLIMPTGEQIIATLWSRLEVQLRQNLSVINEVFEDFCKLKYSDRLALIAERIKAKDNEWGNHIVEGAESSVSSKRDISHYKSVILVSSSFRQSGSSKKMLLEEIALSIPILPA